MKEFTKESGDFYFIKAFLFLVCIVIIALLLVGLGRDFGYQQGILEGAVMNSRNELKVIPIDDGSFTVIDNRNGIKLDRPVIRK